MCTIKASIWKSYSVFDQFRFFTENVAIKIDENLYRLHFVFRTTCFKASHINRKRYTLRYYCDKNYDTSNTTNEPKELARLGHKMKLRQQPLISSEVPGYRTKNKNVAFKTKWRHHIKKNVKLLRRVPV